MNEDIEAVNEFFLRNLRVFSILFNFLNDFSTRFSVVLPDLFLVFARRVYRFERFGGGGGGVP